MVQQAVFTEPDDQSPWFYYRWLLTSMLKVLEDPNTKIEFLTHQSEWLKELLSMETQAKWVLVSLADIYRRLSHEQGQESPVSREQSRDYYTKLLSLDPDHGQLYRDLIAKLNQQKD